MKILGLDIGDKKIGLAVADDSISIASPLDILADGDRSDKIRKICDLVNSENIELIIAGMPYNLKGEIAHQARKVQVFLKHLRKETNVPIETIDERMTSKLAGGGVDDHHAAALILQTWLDRKKSLTDNED